MIWRLIVATSFGAAVGLADVLLHNSYRPFGLLLSLLALALGAYLIREMYKSRLSSWLYVFGWLAVIVRASSIGNGGEILVEANFYGNALVLGGVALLAVSTLRRRNTIN